MYGRCSSLTYISNRVVKLEKVFHILLADISTSDKSRVVRLRVMEHSHTHY